jgi:hypothetical protein
VPNAALDGPVRLSARKLPGIAARIIRVRLRIRGTAQGELSGSKHRRCGAKKAAAIVIDFS